MNTSTNLSSPCALNTSNEYELTFLRSLVASLERQLKKKGYSAGITNDLVFEKTRGSLVQTKQLKKQDWKQFILFPSAAPRGKRVGARDSRETK